MASLVRRTCYEVAVRAIAALSALVLVSALKAEPALAQSEPRVSVEGVGDCPAIDAVSRGLGIDPSLPSAPPSADRVLIEPLAKAGIRLRLLGPEGTVAIDRELGSEDCDALAEAAVLIVRAHFLDLGAPLPPALPSQKKTSEGSSNAEAEARDTPALVASADAAAQVDPTRARPSKVNEAAGPREEAAAWQLELTLALGANVSLPEPTPAGALGMGVGLGSRRTGLIFGLDALALTPVERGESPNRVALQSGALTATLAWRRPGPLWLEPRGGVGVWISRTEALDISQPQSQVGVGPVVRLGMRTGIGLGGWMPFVELDSVVHLTRDRYLVAPRGEIGSGPLVDLRAGLGVVWRP